MNFILRFLYGLEFIVIKLFPKGKILLVILIDVCLLSVKTLFLLYMAVNNWNNIF